GRAATSSRHEPMNQMCDRWCRAQSGVGSSSLVQTSIAASVVVISNRPSNRFMRPMVDTGCGVPETRLATLQLAELHAQLVDLGVELPALFRDLPLVFGGDFVREARQAVVKLPPQGGDLALVGFELLEPGLQLGLALFGHEAFLT